MTRRNQCLLAAMVGVVLATVAIFQGVPLNGVGVWVSAVTAAALWWVVAAVRAA